MSTCLLLQTIFSRAKIMWCIFVSSHNVVQFLVYNQFLSQCVLDLKDWAFFSGIALEWKEVRWIRLEVILSGSVSLLRNGSRVLHQLCCCGRILPVTTYFSFHFFSKARPLHSESKNLCEISLMRQNFFFISNIFLLLFLYFPNTSLVTWCWKIIWSLGKLIYFPNTILHWVEYSTYNTINVNKYGANFSRHLPYSQR